MIKLGRMWSVWQALSALRVSGHGRNRTGTIGGRLMRIVASSLILNATFPIDVFAQSTQPTAVEPATAQPFNNEQLEALVASIALYPDDLLTQMLMASTFPLEVVAASRWIDVPANK